MVWKIGDALEVKYIKSVIFINILLTLCVLYNIMLLQQYIYNF